MTPDKLSEIEFRARNARDFPTVNDAKDCLFIASAKGDVLDLCAALRTAWAERDEARVAYVEAAKQRNDAEARHAFCDENKADLRAHRDRLEIEIADAKTTTEMLSRSLDVQHEIANDVMRERDARPDAATVAQVVGILRRLYTFDEVSPSETEVREALRLLEKP